MNGKPKAFNDFYDLLSDLKIIFPFDWMSRSEGKRMLMNVNTDYSNRSLLELSMFITTIFRSDCIDDISIEQYFENGVMNKYIFERCSNIIY